MSGLRVAGYFRVGTADQLADSVTFENLRVHFFTGKSILLSGSGRDKKYSYRSGVMTDVGDIELSRWRELVHGLIEKANEQALYAQLLKWVKECCPFQHTKEEIETYALELHASRIFDNPQWAAYKEFNEKYRSLPNS